MALTKVTYSMVDGGIANVADFGAVGDNTTDNTQAFYDAVASGAKRIYIPAGEYYFATNPIFDGLSNVTFFGDSAESSVLKWDDDKFAIRAPDNVTFESLGFYPNPDDTLLPTIWVSNSVNTTFNNCIFRGFGADSADTKQSSTCLWIYAGDSSDATSAAGNSENTIITNCRFFGSARKTMFGVRVYTEFNTPGSATNAGAIISNCVFGGFNWNAVEIAGPQTSHAIVSNCVANACGLAPFDLDKGVHDCTVSDVVINRLLGNIDLVANPNTRTGVCGVQGINPTTGYAYNNTVKNVVANLRAVDLNAYGNGCTAVGVAYAQNNVIDGVTVYCDGVPIRGSGAAAQFGLACVSFETAAGNQVRNVLVTNASCGIRQTASQAAQMTSTEPNVFENIKNIGTMTEECISIAKGAATGAYSRNICSNVSFKTNLSDPYDVPPVTGLTNIYAVHAAAFGSSLMFFKLQDSYIELPANSGMWFMYNAINNVGLQNVVINDNGTPFASTRFMNSEGSTVPAVVAIQNVTEDSGRDQIDLASSLGNVGSVSVVGELTNVGLPNYRQVTNFASAQPSAPAAANWNPNVYVEKLTKTSGSTQGWVSVGGAWEEYGSIT